MLFGKNIRTGLCLISITIVLIQASACGFILYPERKGRTTGRIDPGVAILDAILLIPGILPGVMAFAVDFITGCIYLPGGSVDVNHVSEGQNPKHLVQAAEQLDIPTLERLLSQQTGHTVDLDKDMIRVLRVNDVPYIHKHFQPLAKKAVR